MRLLSTRLIGSVAITLLCFAVSLAQTTTNPDISFIGDVRATLHNQPDNVDRNKPMLDLSELEIAGSGNLNPYARADLNLAVGSEGIDIEEAYLTLLKGLPLSLQFKAGKYLVDIGKLNTQHPHQWSWINRPLMHEELFGAEGLKDVGINLNALYPMAEGTLGFSVNWLRNGGLIPDSLLSAPYTPAHRNPGYAMRVSSFYPTSDNSNIDLGISTMRGQIYSVAASSELSDTLPPSSTAQFLRDYTPAIRAADIHAIDLKWKWKPDNYHSAEIVAEYMTQSREVQELETTIHQPVGGATDTTVNINNRKRTSHGLFAAVSYRWNRRYDAGIIYDYTQQIADNSHSKRAIGAFAALSLAEETTRFGVSLRRNMETGVDPYLSGTFQILWFLGPHKPHTF